MYSASLNTNNLQFTSFTLATPILSALDKAGYKTPTPIQAQAIPVILEKNDVLACAQTGTGKTASFALPLIQHILDASLQDKAYPQALILAPTRELAIQIGENIQVYASRTQVKHAVVFGGVPIHKQLQALRNRPAILVATPGRLLDLIQQKAVRLNRVAYLVLDEADRMLDMGFIKDIQRIISLVPSQRQTLLFSATMPKSIEAFAQSILHKPVRITVAPVSSTAEKIEQRVFPVEKPNKTALLIHLLKQENKDHILVFSRTKYGADKIVRKLKQAGIVADAIHGNKTQQQRQKALSRFKSGSIKALVATDIAARGIDVDHLHLVINYDLPNEPETYVHRIGRTGRAGASGRAWSFCDIEEREYLWDIQQLIQMEIDLESQHPYPVDAGVSYEKPKRQHHAGKGRAKQGKKYVRKRKPKSRVHAA